MSIILGSENILHVKRSGGEFERVGFLTVNSHQKDTSFLKTTTRENAGFSTEVPLEISSTIDFSAIIFEDSDLTGKIGYKELNEIQDNFERIEWKLEVLNKNLTRYGFAYISGLGEESSVDDAMSFSGSLNVYGKILELTDIEPPSRPLLSADIEPNNPSVTLSWTAATDNLAVDYYEIRKALSNQPETFITVGNVLTYEDFSVAYFTFYGYNVRAIDVSGNIGPWSNKVKAQIPIPFGQPDPSYKYYQDGTLKIYQNGIPKAYQ